MAIFSFHAEFGQDVAVLRRRLAEQGIRMNIFTYPDHRVTEVAVELHTDDLTINELRTIMDEIPDGHVMERTLEEGEFPKLKQRREELMRR